MTLKTKIQLFSNIFMLILIIVINTSIYFLFYNISANNELDELVKETNTIVETLNMNEELPKSELLQAFLPTNGMIRIINKNGESVIPLLLKTDADRHIPYEFSTSESRAIYNKGSNASSVIVSRPIIWDSGEVVTLQVSNSLIGLQKTMRTLLFVLIIASLITLIPTMIAARILSKFLLRPIQTLIQTMQENTKQARWKKIEILNESGDELNEMEKTFNMMIDHIKNNFERQEQFISDASHELRTPISIIKSYAQLLQRRGKTYPEVFEEAVDAIDSEADRMEQLIHQLFLLAKDKNSVTFEIVDFNALCQKIVTRIRTASNRTVTFKSSSKLLYINGNESQLQQVVYILLDNALKYSEKTVDVKLLVETDHVMLYIKDYGPGIPLNEQKHIFDRFYRLDKARTRETGGSGLGLSIAKAIVNMHAGQLHVKSDGVNGSTFILSLPIS